MWLKTVEFRRPRLVGTSFGLVPQNLVKFSFCFIFTYLKISCVQLKRLKSLNFGGPCLGGTPILKTPIFVRFSVFLIYTYFKKFDPSSSNNLKVYKFGGLVGGVSPILVPTKFVKFYLSFMFNYLKNFVCPAKKVKKFEFWRTRSGRTSILEPSIFLMFNLFLISTHPENLIHLPLSV